MFEDEEPFPILVNPEGLDRLCQLKGHISITNLWREFLKSRPEAKDFETQLNPPPWNELRAQPFQFVKNEDVPELLSRWSKQVDVLLEIS